MSLPRFYCPNLQAGRATIAAQDARHATTVLRLGVGDRVELFDGKGRIAAGSIDQATRGSVVVRVDGEPNVVATSRPALTLCTAIPRAARQPFLFEKCTELGVATIVPTLFKRSTVRPEHKSAQRWRRAVVEAGKQCGCVWLPQIAEPANLSDTLIGRPERLLLVGALAPDAESILDVLHQSCPLDDAAVWIGPEGGLTDDEQGALRGLGARPVRLGRNVLRVETAAIAAAVAFALRANHESVEE